MALFNFNRPGGGVKKGPWIQGFIKLAGGKNRRVILNKMREGREQDTSVQVLVKARKMQSSVCQRWDHSDLLRVDSGAQDLLGRERDSQLLILVVSTILAEETRSCFEAHLGGGDQEHPKEDVKCRTEENNGEREAQNSFQTNSIVS